MTSPPKGATLSTPRPSMWELLFKYPPVVFQNGRLVWAAPVPAWAVLLALGLLLAGLAWSYRRAAGRVGRRDRLVLLGLRAAALGLLAFCLLRPTLLLPVAVPQRNYLAVLIDDSRSMRIADREGESRESLVRQAFDPESSALLRALGERFQLRMLRFSDVARRMESPEELGFSGRRSDLARALDRAREELALAPLSGMLLVSDGADNAAGMAPDAPQRPGSDPALEASLLALKAASVPVFSVGVGRESWERDIEVSRVSAPARVMRGSSLLVDVVLQQTGYSGETVELVVEEGGRIVDVQEVALPRDGAPAVVRARLVAEQPGPRSFRFRVPVRDGERVLENNQRDALIEVRDERAKILYFEGEPRFEVKFLRRAVADDPQLQLVVLQRTAENRFLRLDVDSAAELEAGFPQTREELFAYDGLILGSVEASYFSDAQLRMIADFVAERGGGLLMLGGRRSFSEGGYAGTPLADALPVSLDPRDRDTTFFAELRVQPTREGRSHAALQLDEDPARSAARWSSLPPLSTFNRVREVKPGATALLAGSGPGLGEQVVLAQHRFGRGRAAALAVQDSWIWQMHSSIALEDMTHERLWRQMLRWLVAEVPGPVEVVAAPQRPAPGEPVRLTARVRDRAYRPAHDAAVAAVVEGPDGEPVEVPLRWRSDGEGEYVGSFTPRAEGMHRVAVTAGAEEGQPPAGETVWVRAGEEDEEFFAAQMREPLLRRIAEETGGRFFASSELSSLPDEISYRGRGVTVTEEREIWDMPIVLLMLIALLSAEWGYRRLRRLP